MTSLKQFVEQASWQVEKLFKKQGAIYAMYHYVRRDGQNVVMLAAGGSKDESVAIARAQFEHDDVVRYVYIDEAWMMDYQGRENFPSAEEIKRHQRQGIRNEPGRIEIVLFSAEDENEPMIMARREIIRPVDHEPYLSKLEFLPERGQPEGRMVGLLPRKKLAS